MKLQCQVDSHIQVHLSSMDCLSDCVKKAQKVACRGLGQGDRCIATSHAMPHYKKYTTWTTNL